MSNIFPLVFLTNVKKEKILFLSVENLLFSLTCLKHHFNYQYTVLSAISGVDFFYSKYRFNVVYELMSVTFGSRLRLKVGLNETTVVPSSVHIFKNANWWEREVWDMYGIFFQNHPDLRRILTDYGFEGYPMRKDYPLSGFVELRYDQNKKRIVIDQLELSQDFRLFTFTPNW